MSMKNFSLPLLVPIDSPQPPSTPFYDTFGEGATGESSFKRVREEGRVHENDMISQPLTITFTNLILVQKKV